jgi:hypothetical protein
MGTNATTTTTKKTNQIITHARFMSAELLTISDRHYFHYNGNSYSITKEQLNKVLLEIKNMNPLSAIQHLIKLVENKQFIKITK